MAEKFEDILHRIAMSMPFSRLGERTQIGGCIWVPNLEMAFEQCKQESWTSLQLQTSNWLRREVRSRNFERISRHNHLVEMIKRNDHFQEILQAAAKFATDSQRSFVVSCQWDLLLICFEAEYSDLVSPLFYLHRILPVYLLGHVPCGWSGTTLNTGWDGVLPKVSLYIY